MGRYKRKNIRLGFAVVKLWGQREVKPTFVAELTAAKTRVNMFLESRYQ